MAAVTLALDTPANTTLSGTPDVMQEFKVPRGARWVYVYSRTNAAKLVLSGVVDAGALGAGAYMTIPANTPTRWPVPGVVDGRPRGVTGTSTIPDGLTSIALASGTASTVDEVWASSAE